MKKYKTSLPHAAYHMHTPTDKVKRSKKQASQRAHERERETSRASVHNLGAEVCRAHEKEREREREREKTRRASERVGRVFFTRSLAGRRRPTATTLSLSLSISLAMSPPPAAAERRHETGCDVADSRSLSLCPSSSFEFEIHEFSGREEGAEQRRE